MSAGGARDGEDAAGGRGGNDATAGAVISAVPTSAPAATAPERERPLTSRPAPVRTNPTARDQEGSPPPVSASRRLTTTAMPAAIKAVRPGPSRRTRSA